VSLIVIHVHLFQPGAACQAASALLFISLLPWLLCLYKCDIFRAGNNVSRFDSNHVTEQVCSSSHRDSPCILFYFLSSKACAGRRPLYYTSCAQGNAYEKLQILACQDDFIVL
jgi:hypothetical protein